MPFSDIRISQGSVATSLKRGGIFKHALVANLLPSLLVKKNWKSDNSWWSYGQEFGVLFFWLTVYIYVLLYAYHTTSRALKQMCVLPDANHLKATRKAFREIFKLP